MPPGAVVFEGAGVALVPGEHWKELRSGPLTTKNDVCLPVLEGEGPLTGMVIHVLSSPANRTRPEQKAARMRLDIYLSPQTIKDSFKQEEFTSESGLAEIHVSYDFTIEAKGVKVKGRNHAYIVSNDQGAVVGIGVGEIASKDSEAVHEMVRKTLRLK